MTSTVFIKVQILDPNKLNEMSLIHHYLTSTLFICCLLTGYYNPGSATCCLLCEFSNIFLNFRDFFDKNARNEGYGLANELLFLVTFTYFRVILFPYLILRNFNTVFAIWNLFSLFEKLLHIFINLSGFSILLLNYYWYSLMLKTVVKVLKPLF